MASAWLVKRFVDARARFAFAAAAGPKRKCDGKEVLFDTPGGDFTHEGDLCTFEVLASRFALADLALRAIGELVHDVDLKDAKFARPEAPGLARLANGIALANDGDDARLTRAFALFDDLYEGFRGRKKV
jgi:hypothetical protein